jgi:hypothetical protein
MLEEKALICVSGRDGLSAGSAAQKCLMASEIEFAAGITGMVARNTSSEQERSDRRIEVGRQSHCSDT